MYVEVNGETEYHVGPWDQTRIVGHSAQVPLLTEPFLPALFLKNTEPYYNPPCPQTHCVAEAGLEKLTLLSLSPKSWDYKSGPATPYFISKYFSMYF